ncbi:MAG: Alpha/beta fold hydrolase [Thermoproteota archaeon]|nr:Alpha/beta fold hydrolase [Thermoproteota archaeon]
MQVKWSEVKDCLKTVFGKTVPFATVIAFQYIPKRLFNIWFLPSFIGFLIEFLWIITPIFVITTRCSWWFHRNTGKTTAGALFNVLILSWVAAVVFPF